jgi:hypothetical protein
MAIFRIFDAAPEDDFGDVMAVIHSPIGHIRTAAWGESPVIDEILTEFPFLPSMYWLWSDMMP